MSRQVSRGTDVPVRIFSYSLFPLAECVIPDAYQTKSVQVVQAVQPLRSVQSLAAVQSLRFKEKAIRLKLPNLRNLPKLALRLFLHLPFRAKKRFGLCVLDYMVTSNHIHFLEKDTGPNGNVTEAKARFALWFTRRVSAGDGL